MALVKYGAPVDEVAGSIGGVVFQRSSAGHIARARAKPIVRHSSARSHTTSLLSSYSMAWYSVLTNGERAAWDAVAAGTTWTNSLGQNYSPTGYAAYIRSALVVEAANETPRARAPTALDEAPRMFTFDYLAPKWIRLTGVGGLASPPDGFVILDRSDPQPATVNTYNGPWPTHGYVQISAIPGLPWALYALPLTRPESNTFIDIRILRTVDDPAPPPYYFGQCSARWQAAVYAPAN